MPSLTWSLLIVMIYVLTGHHIATGEITGISLVRSDTTQSYKGKIEVRYRECNGDWCSSNEWYAICHDGSDDDDHNNWDRAAATTACKQLGFEAGWDGSAKGITTDYTFENFTCSDTATSLDNCTHEPYELLGCSPLGELDPRRLVHHWIQNQAYVECYNLPDTSVSLDPYSDTTGTGPTQGFLEVVYRNYWYDVCFSGADDDDQDWGLDEANVVCRQLGYPLGAAQTTRLSSTSNNHRSFDDFRCNEDTEHLFSCFPDPPNNSGCGENNRVFIKCKELVQEGTTTDINDELSTAGITTLMYTNDDDHVPKPDDTTAASNKSDSVVGTPNDAENQIDGIIIGIPVGVVVTLIIVIVVCVICFVQYRRRGKTAAQSEPQITTTVHSNETFHNENEYDVQNGGTEYAYAYADYDRSGGNVSAQEQTNSIAENHRGPSVSDGWADNVAYVSHGEDTRQDVSDGWADNVAYVSHGDDTEETVQEGWMDNTIYAGD